MREWIAHAVCALTFALVIALAALFAARHNAPRGAPAITATPTPAQAIEGERFAHARLLFSEQGCALCHSFAGEGNPRLPLDDVARRLGAKEIRTWITATGPALAELPPGTAKRKARYQNLPAGDLDALVDWLTQAPPAATPPATRP